MHADMPETIPVTLDATETEDQLEDQLEDPRETLSEAIESVLAARDSAGLTMGENLDLARFLLFELHMHHVETLQDMETAFEASDAVASPSEFIAWAADAERLSAAIDVLNQLDFSEVEQADATDEQE
ncbi:MAG: hypothetical protein RLZZ468_229 [Cyanobacteriota bacterium]|jgi:hypothetical protein